MRYLCSSALRGTWFCGNPVTPLCLRVTPSTKFCGSAACPPTSSSSFLLTVPCSGMLSPHQSTWRGSTLPAAYRKDLSCFFLGLRPLKRRWCSFSSCRTFKRLWKQVAQNLDIYRTFPRLAGGEHSLGIFIRPPSVVCDAQHIVCVVRVRWEELPLRAHICGRPERGDGDDPLSFRVRRPEVFGVLQDVRPRQLVATDPAAAAGCPQEHQSGRCESMRSVYVAQHPPTRLPVFICSWTVISAFWVETFV